MSATLDTRFIEIIRSLIKPTSTTECSWERYKLQTNAWQKKRDYARDYLRSERGRMSLAAVSEQIGCRPSLTKINAIAYMTDIQLHAELLVLEAYFLDKLSLKLNIAARVSYMDMPTPTRVGVYTKGYSKQWYQSYWS